MHALFGRTSGVYAKKRGLGFSAAFRVSKRTIPVSGELLQLWGGHWTTGVRTKSIKANFGHRGGSDWKITIPNLT